MFLKTTFKHLKKNFFNLDILKNGLLKSPFMRYSTPSWHPFRWCLLSQYPGSIYDMYSMKSSPFNLFSFLWSSTTPTSSLKQGERSRNAELGKNGPMVIWHTWDRVFIHHLADQVQSFCDFHWEVVSILQVLHQHLLFDQLCWRLLFLYNFFNLITTVVMWRILTVLTWAWTYTAHLFVSSSEDARETGSSGHFNPPLPHATVTPSKSQDTKIQILPSDLATKSQQAVEQVPVLQCTCSRDMPAQHKGIERHGPIGVNSIKMLMGLIWTWQFPKDRWGP